jgi:hypothetical protein
MPRDVLPHESDLSTDDLFALVLDDQLDEGSLLAPLVALHNRPTREVVQRSLALCRSVHPGQRIIGLRVLRELSHPLVDRKLLWEPIEPMVIQLAADETDPDVLQWAVSCLGYQPGGAEALSAVLAHVDHEDHNVRFAVVASLPALVDPAAPADEAVTALIRLTDDPDADVRSYAFMGLHGDLGLATAPAVRSAFERHRTDPDPQIRRYVHGVLDTPSEKV